MYPLPFFYCPALLSTLPLPCPYCPCLLPLLTAPVYSRWSAPLSIFLVVRGVVSRRSVVRGRGGAEWLAQSKTPCPLLSSLLLP